MTDLNSSAEQNARMRARADYFRWLLKYYGSAELADMSDEPEPVSLRQIFVPMRLAHDAQAETEMAGPEQVASAETEATLPGVDAFQLLAEQAFICLSGLPGSGKTTLTKALIGELCGPQPSLLRSKLQGQRGIAPVLIVLREIADLQYIHNFQELMEAWWQNLHSKSTQGDSLDIARLRHSFNQDEDGEKFPLLILLDGIDESGGPDVRQKLLHIASEAHNQYQVRILITGRPNGFEQLSLPQLKYFEDNTYVMIHSVVKIGNDCLYHLLPLSWPQIQTFVNRWYRLRPEWEIKQSQGVTNFLQALQDSSRAYLLTLARRPIFLTLMTLVHCTRNEMPHGRADLYEAIVDLYLNRQERHRQLRQGISGKTLKVWPALEKRRVLARIAYQSQILGSEQQKDRNNPEQRRILWPQAELLTFIKDYLQQRSSSAIAATEAEDLLEYFLHPAGLLISPRQGEISFAHLSFQEYLCADDIQRRLSGFKFQQVFHDDLAQHLPKPGWDEVALLLLVMQKHRTEDGHLELLGLLRPHIAAEAKVLVHAVCGKELALSEAQQQAWLPVLIMASLLNPFDALARFFRLCPHLELTGLRLVIELLKANTDIERQWHYLWQFVTDEALVLVWLDDQTMVKEFWLSPPWQQDETEDAARFYSLLWILHFTRWGCGEDPITLLPEPNLESALNEAINNEHLLWLRKTVEIPNVTTRFRTVKTDAGNSFLLPISTGAGILLNLILPAHGDLWRKSLSLIPLDAWLLLGELVSEIVYETCSPASVLLVFYPQELLPARSRLALGLYQALMLLEDFPLLNLKSSLSPLQNDARGQLTVQVSSYSLRALLRSLLKSPTEHLQNFSSRLLSLLLRFQNVVIKLKYQMAVCDKQLQKLNLVENEENNKHIDGYLQTLRCFGYHLVTHDWFTEQAENPALMTSRGLQPGQPLPRNLGLFDEQGLPLERQQRANWLKLQTWLQDDDAILGFFFPEGLPADEEAVLRKDLAILKTQPWSPQAFIATVLQEEWPPEQPEMDFSFATSQQEMLAACEAFLQQARLEEPK